MLSGIPAWVFAILAVLVALAFWKARFSRHGTGTTTRRERQRARADALEPVVRAAMDSVVDALGSSLWPTQIGWLEVATPLAARRRALYIVFPTDAELDETLAARALADIEPRIRAALRSHGYPAELEDGVSVNYASLETLRRSLGPEVADRARMTASAGLRA